VPGVVPPVPDERTGLLAFLGQQRHVLRTAAYGLSHEQARATPTVSTLSIGGLIKHAAAVERSWMETVMRRGRPGTPGELTYDEHFSMRPSDTLRGLLDSYSAAADLTAAVIASIDDLGDPVPVPPDLPWMPAGVGSWSVRWVLLHLTAETARHAGHADIVREELDGATAFSLLAAVEGWEESPWVRPWTPPP
jgi:hypothetical protein